MAERRNYYEIIDKLPFDPMEIKDKKIIDAIDLWKLLEEKRGISNEEANGEQRQQELDMYDDIKACLTDKERRKAEADAMKQKQKQKLSDIIAVLKESGGKDKLYISNARIVSIAKSLRLDKEKTVKKAFTDAGFEIIVRKPVNITNDILLSNTVFKTVSENTVKLAGMSSKDYPWLGQVRSLYDLAAYFKNDGEHASDYQHKSAEELKSIMEAGAASVAGKLDTLNHCFADLFQAGCTQIFKDEKTKIKYDNSLKMENLFELFALLKEMPEEMKKDSYIADVCIKKIQVYFSDPDVALAIYNREAGNALDPYEPDSGDVDFVCGSCKSTSKIKYGTDKATCKCQACGTPLFVKCGNSKCGHLIPAIADICPDCGYNLIEAKFFDRYCALAESAMESGNVEEARKQLALAKGARPDDIRLKQLETKITTEMIPIEAAIKEIRLSMNQNKYVQASNQLAAFCVRYPKIKVDDIKSDIEKMISLADSMFAQIETKSDKCGVCFDILDKVSDYSKALDYIKDKKPKQVNGLNATVSTSSNQITVKWAGTGEREVTYYLIRKENGKPQSINDGIQVLKNQLVTQYVDSSIQPGIAYYYAVFSHRIGTYSDATCSEACVLFRELDEKSIVKNTDDGKCIISWQLPINCRGVRVLRSDSGKTNIVPGGNTVVVADNISNGFEDKNVKNGVKYEYRLQCIYNIAGGLKYSDGVTFSLMPDSKPQKATLVSTLVKSENSVQISWSVEKSDPNALLDIYDITSGINVTEGTTYHVSELVKIGSKLTTIPNISQKTAEVRISQKKGYRVCAVIVKGEYAVVSNCLSFSNFDKLELNKANTKITGGNLVIQLVEKFQPNLANIRYAVATKNDDTEPAPWCKIEDAPNMTQIAVNAYLTDGMIRIGRVPEKELYISVIGEYSIGQEVYYSEPAKLRLSNRPKAAISYSIVWGFLNKKKNVKLILECDMDQELPEMYLCTNKTLKVPMSPTAPNNILLCKISENMNYRAHTRIEIEISNEIWSSTTKGNEIRLFIPEDSYSEFRMAPEVGTLRIP